VRRRDFIKTVAVAGAAAAIPPNAAQGAVEATATQQPGADRTYVERYTGQSRVRSGMALGGIGAGYFELRKNGRFYDWNIFNNFPKETGPAFTLPDGEVEDRMAANLFFEVRYQVEGEQPRIKLLQLNDSLYEGNEMGIAFSLPWMQAVDSIEYSARFPIATLVFTDPEMPFMLRLEAWSSFIPHDVKNSSLPLVFFDFQAIATTSRKVDVTLLMTSRNNAGYDTPSRYYTAEIARADDALTVSMGCGGMDERASSWGQITIASLSAESSYYAGWAHRHPYHEQVLRHAVLPDIDDTNGVKSAGQPLPSWLPVTNGRNTIDRATHKLRALEAGHFNTVAHTFTLNESGRTEAHTFLYAWNFPNLYNEREFRVQGDTIEGHYYSNYFSTAMEMIQYGVAQRTELKRRTLEFLDHFFQSDADVELLEQVNSQLNTFFTSGRLVRNGDFGMLEGLSSTWSWGPIATIDVMYYGSAPIVALFPELQMATMRCHAREQSPAGEINHGLLKDFTRGEDSTAGVSHRVDLHGQFAIMVMRDFFWTNDQAYLRELMPAVERAIGYVLRERSGSDGAMPMTKNIETSYDNFPMFGYASYLLSQWLCTMASARDASVELKDDLAAQRYEHLLAATRQRMEEKLWNGSYYRLFADPAHSDAHGDAGEGCLTDQLAGQWAAHSSGLGSLLPAERIHVALRTILSRNFTPSVGLKNCGFRADGGLGDVDRDIWGDQANTTWTGVELAFASLLLYEGMYDEGMTVVKNVNARYRKNGLYWNHQEFGGHYFRPMSAWSLVNALLGFSMHCGRLTFDPRLPQAEMTLFFATPTGTAHYRRMSGRTSIVCRTGTIDFKEIRLRDVARQSCLLDGEQLAAAIVDQDGWRSFVFASEQSLLPHQALDFV